MWNIFQKTRLSLQHAGVARTAQLALQRLVPDWLFDINSLIAIEVDFADCRVSAVADEWPHRWADEDDLELLTQAGYSAAEVRAFFAEGARAAVCEHDGKLIACAWPVLNDHTVFGWMRVIVGRKVHGRAGYVAPEFRGREIHFETRNFMYSALADLGYTGIVSFIEHLNRSALHAGGNTPRRYVGRLFYVRLLGLVVYRLDDKWGAGSWNRTRPFELSFDVFDRENFRVENRHARSSLDGPPDPGSQ
jgi:hypothetical protein